MENQTVAEVKKETASEFAGRKLDSTANLLRRYGRVLSEEVLGDMQSRLDGLTEEYAYSPAKVSADICAQLFNEVAVTVTSARKEQIKWLVTNKLKGWKEPVYPDFSITNAAKLADKWLEGPVSDEPRANVAWIEEGWKLLKGDLESPWQDKLDAVKRLWAEALEAADMFVSAEKAKGHDGQAMFDWVLDGNDCALRDTYAAVEIRVRKFLATCEEDEELQTDLIGLVFATRNFVWDGKFCKKCGKPVAQRNGSHWEYCRGCHSSYMATLPMDDAHPTAEKRHVKKPGSASKRAPRVEGYEKPKSVAAKGGKNKKK